MSDQDETVRDVARKRLEQQDACPGSGHRVTGPEITRERGKTPMARCPECKQLVEVYEAGAGRHWRAMRKWHHALQPVLEPQDQIDRGAPDAIFTDREPNEPGRR